MYTLINPVELPPSSGYGSLLTAKNYENNAGLNLSRSKPDPLADMPTYQAIYMANDDFRAPSGHDALAAMEGKAISMQKEFNESPRREKKIDIYSANGGLVSPLKKPRLPKEMNSSQIHENPVKNGVQTIASPTREQIKTTEKVGYLFSSELRVAKRHEERTKEHEMKQSTVDSGNVNSDHSRRLLRLRNLLENYLAK